LESVYIYTVFKPISLFYNVIYVFYYGIIGFSIAKTNLSILTGFMHAIDYITVYL